MNIRIINDVIVNEHHQSIADVVSRDFAEQLVETFNNLKDYEKEVEQLKVDKDILTDEVATLKRKLNIKDKF